MNENGKKVALKQSPAAEANDLRRETRADPRIPLHRAGNKAAEALRNAAWSAMSGHRSAERSRRQVIYGLRSVRGRARRNALVPVTNIWRKSAGRSEMRRFT